MRSLILGGTSFVGGRLLERLQRRGDQVTLLNRGRSSSTPAGVELLAADRKDSEAMRAALGGGRAWARVGRFLGPSIEEHYARTRTTRMSWPEADLHDGALTAGC